MGYIYALRSIYVHQLRYGMDLNTAVFSLVTHIPFAAVLAWIVGNGSSPIPVDYLFVGVFLMSVWNWIAIRMGWTLTGDLIIGTFDYTTTSRTPLGVVIFARAIALTTASVPSGLAPVMVIAIVSRQMISVSEPLVIPVALGVGILSVISVAFVFSPLFLLIRGRDGLFNLIRPLGVVFCGFLYPVTFLAPEAEVVSRFLPVSWAMDAVLLAIETKGSGLEAFRKLGIALLLCGAYLAISYLLLRKLDHRMRVNGDLSRF